MYKARLFLLILLIGLTTSLRLPAQSFSFTHWGIEDGLINNFVTDIAQDSKGCIWFATESGLSQFDGYTFTNYKSNRFKNRQDALKGLYYDKNENKLWMCGKFDGVYTLDCTTYEINYYNEADNYAFGHVGSISPAADGGLWLASSEGAVVHYNPFQHQFTVHRFPKMLPYEKNIVFDDGNGSLYIGFTHDGLEIVNIRTKAVRRFSASPANIDGLPGNSVYDIKKDKHNNIWLGTNMGLALYHPTTGTFTVFRHTPNDPGSLISDHVYTLQPMNDGTFWISTDIGGISILNTDDLLLKTPSSIHFQNILPSDSPNSLSSGNIRSLLQDKAGNIWVGNYSSGVDFLSHEPNIFSILPYKTNGEEPQYKSVWGLYVDKEQRLWAGGENEVAIFKDNQLQKRISLTSTLSRSYVQVFCITEDENGNMLLGLYDDGLLKYEPGTGRLSRLPLKQSNTDVVCFYTDTDRSIWVGTEYGIYHYIKGQLKKETGINNQLYDGSIYGFVRDRQGKLWVGTFYGGISVFDKNNRRVAQLDLSNGFCSNAINNIIGDARGGIWVATRNGLGYIPDTNHPEKFFCYNDAQGLANNFVRSVQEDKSGHIWVSTNDGISRWNGQKQQFDNYSYRNGLPSGNFIEGSSARTADGLLYFGSLKGICYFKPQMLLSDRTIPPVQLISCKELGNQMENTHEEELIPIIGNSIELPYDRNSFRLSFSVPDYAISQQVEYAYQIKGLDDKWSNIANENDIVFRNLPYGHYTFKVKARLKNQAWDEAHIATLSIRIKPPFYWAWYAKTFYLLLLIAGTAWGLRIYKRRLQLRSELEIEKKKNENEQELNEERLRFYTNITHELRTPLTLILGPLEDLSNDRQLPPVYQPRVKVIYNSARRLLNLINQLLEFRKAETQNRQLTVSRDNLNKVVTETGLRFKELNRNPQVRFNIQVEAEPIWMYFDRDIITTVLSNLLSNAVKYTPQGSITLRLRTEVSADGIAYVEIIVSDTGYGIDKEALPHIFDRYYQAKGKHQASGTGIGLALVRSLVHLHEGTLHVESEVGKGTTFTVRLKTDETYPHALHKETEQQSSLQPLEEIEPSEKDSRQTIILVVEDNDDIRDYIASSFDSSVKVLKARNGQEGWELAETNIPDIIISDIMMPVMDGIELCRKVKEDIRTSHIPVILLTAKDSIQDKEEGYDNGADSYLTKPFSAKLLLSRVRNLLESRKKLAAIISRKAAGGIPLPTDGQPTGLNKVSEEFLNKFTATVESNITKEELDMPFMADKMNMSHSTLYRKIKGLTGGSGNEFIRKIKLRHSLKLMQEKGFTISEAAYSSGFNDIAYYRRCFKKEYGMLPSEYIKKL